MNFDAYKSKVFEDFARVKTFFPLLEIVDLPSRKPVEISISGFLIPIDFYKLSTSENLDKYGLNIKAVYPFDFPLNEVVVRDIDNKIEWDKIPLKYHHIHSDGTLCTHHPLAEINGVSQCNRTVAILLSAWRLYLQSVDYIKTGVWNLKDLRHGNQDDKKLRSEGWLKY